MYKVQGSKLLCTVSPLVCSSEGLYSCYVKERNQVLLLSIPTEFMTFVYHCSSFVSMINFVLWLQGLLQSEVEGVDNESVGFYGRCALHATYPMCESDSDPADRVAGGSAVEELTCARTEVF